MADLPTNFTDATQTDGDVHAGAHNDANVKINRLVNNSMSTATRNALAGDDLYVGRVIWNTTTEQIEVYDGTVWVEISSWNLSHLDTDLTYNTGDLSVVEYFDKTPTLRADETLAYTGGYGSGGNLSTVTRRYYDDDGTTVIRTVTETLTYTGDDLTSTTKVVT